MGADNTCICCSPSSPQTKYLRVMDSLLKAESLVVATICIHNALQAYDVRCHFYSRLCCLIFLPHL